MKKIFLTIAIAFVAINTYAQSYNTALGIRLEDDFKFSISQRVFNHTTLESNLSDGLFSNRKYASLAIKQHHNIITRRLNFFVGAGYYGQSLLNEKDEVQDFTFKNQGILTTFGAEMTIGRLNVSVDYSPQYSLSSDYTGKRLSADSAISLKYVLWKRQSKAKKFIKNIF